MQKKCIQKSTFIGIMKNVHNKGIIFSREKFMLFRKRVKIGGVIDDTL